MQNLNEWAWYWQVVYTFITFGIVAFLIGIRDGYRQKSAAKPNDKKLQKTWHLWSGIVYGTASAVYAFAVYGLDPRVVAIAGLAIIARWWGVDGGFNYLMKKAFSYVGTGNFVDGSMNGKWAPLVLKSLCLALSILISWLIFTKL